MKTETTTKGRKTSFLEYPKEKNETSALERIRNIFVDIIPKTRERGKSISMAKKVL